MRRSFFRELARRCRGLVKTAQTDAVKQQLGSWEDELDEQAEATEGKFDRHQPKYQTRSD